MSSKYLRAGLACLGLAAACVAASVAIASSVNITPAGDTVLATSPKVKITAGSVTITCETTIQSAGTIATPAASSMTLDAPVFPTGKVCTSTGPKGEEYSASGSETAGHWELAAISATSGSVTIPREGLQVKWQPEFEGPCTLEFARKAPVTMTGVWTAGTAKSPLAHPSTLALSEASVLTGIKGPCATGITEHAETIEGRLYITAKITGTLTVNDTTHFNEPVVFK